MLKENVIQNNEARTESSVEPSHPDMMETVPEEQQKPISHIDDLLSETANLMAVKEQLLKEIAENEHIHSMQMRALQNLPQEAILPLQYHADPRRRHRMQKPESYKTVICQAWLESKTCAFAENCRFAHGEEELRPSLIEARQNNKYRTKLCDKYTTTGLCPYGKRCLFIHPDNGPNAYIRADKLFEVSQRHALADLRDQMEHHIMNGGRSTAGPQQFDMFARPCTPDEPAANMPLGPTPVSIRGPRYELPSKKPLETEEAGNRPPSSWPLDPSTFFALDSLNMATRPISPFESMLIGAAGNMQYSMLGKQSTPGGVSGYSSSGSTPSQDSDSSPLTAASAAADAACQANSESAQSILLKSINNPMIGNETTLPIPGLDQLAMDIAKHLELW